MYTYGQTRDRVEYAQRRIAEVVSGDTEPPFQLPSGADTVARHTPELPPEKGQAAVLPPPAVVPAPGTAASSDAALAVNAANGALVACQSRCEAASASCLPGCETRPTGCKPCETPLDVCLRDCQAEGH